MVPRALAALRPEEVGVTVATTQNTRSTADIYAEDSVLLPRMQG